MPVIVSVTVSSCAGPGEAAPKTTKKYGCHQRGTEINLPSPHKNHLLCGYCEGITAIILTPTPGGAWNNHENEIPILSARFHLKEVRNGKT
jgi:hypothetical protein